MGWAEGGVGGEDGHRGGGAGSKPGINLGILSHVPNRVPSFLYKLVGSFAPNKGFYLFNEKEKFYIFNFQFYNNPSSWLLDSSSLWFSEAKDYLSSWMFFAPCWVIHEAWSCIRARCLSPAWSQHLLQFNCDCTVPMKSSVNIKALTSLLSVFSLSPTPLCPLISSSFYSSPTWKISSFHLTGHARALPKAHNDSCAESEDRNQAIHKEPEDCFSFYIMK